MIRILSIVFLLHSLNMYAQTRASIPKGEVHGPFQWTSKIYPGTIRDYWIYVPKQYDPSGPACSMIVQDGLNRANDWKLTTTLDSLIELKEIPVIIGIYIDHGKVPATGNDNYPRFNRSYEYDALGDHYARFLIEEIIPEVSKSYNLSLNPNDRSIAGASSGGICAFNVAWERPDQFRRVLSTIGTYVGLRGGDEFATLVRKTEPKPLRIFLEDGDHDLNIYAGDWWMANQDMLSALTWAGYEVNHSWGDGGHNGKHAAQIMAEALKWLWKDYPEPIQAHEPPEQRIDLTINDESWKEIQLHQIPVDKLAVGKEGEIFLTAEKSVYRLDKQNNPSVLTKLNGIVGGIAVHETTLYVGDLTNHQINGVDKNGSSKTLISNVDANFIVVATNGIYFSDMNKKRIGFYNFSTKDVTHTIVDGSPTGLAISAEKTFLNVAMADKVFGYSFKINEDGSLLYGQEYIHYHIPYKSLTAEVKGMTVDSENILYSATNMGIQASDQLGRINFIFSQPGAHPLTDVKLGEENLSTLYVVAGGKLYVRKINAKGVLSWEPAVKPPRPGL